MTSATPWGDRRESGVRPQEYGPAPLLDTALGRYLELLKAALLDEHYLENEVRIDYLAGGSKRDVVPLRDPRRLLPDRYQQLAQARTSGKPLHTTHNVASFPYTDMGRVRIDHLHRALDDLVAARIEGDLLECGVGRGGGAMFLQGYLCAHQIDDRRVWLVDPFRAAAETVGSNGTDGQLAAYLADLLQVRDGFAAFDLLDEHVRFVQGDPVDALCDAPIERLALARIAARPGVDVGAVLERLYERMSPGGMLLVEGTDDPEVVRQVAAARARLGTIGPLEQVDWNEVAWTVPGARPSPALTLARTTLSRPLRRTPVAPQAPTAPLALSVVVVFYNMRREAPRTLRSLSRPYQRDVDSLDYEVIVVENGSSTDQRLGEDLVRSYGPEFRYLDMGSDAPTSPTSALNRGIAEARGDAVALMIDGAHVLTPGVLRLGLTALSTYAPAVVATQHWYVGPGQQGDAVKVGYDQQAEDQLFQRIEWPVDGYRLFEIGHFIGERDWFDGIFESNCLFTPRALLEQAGGFDDGFVSPGGGYANLELFERLGHTPDVRVVSLLGEATFHQVHGGTTTNVADEATRRSVVHSANDEFRALRGRSLVGLDRPIHYMGALATKAARRTRSRRAISLSFDTMRDPTGPAGRSEHPVPVAEELRHAAVEALWDSGAWLEATWLGLPVKRLATDLQILQELIVEARPRTVVLLGDDDGLAGRALFCAGVARASGGEMVVAVGGEGRESPDDLVINIAGNADDPQVAAEVTRLAGPDPSAIVVIGLGSDKRVRAAFDMYAQLVPIGSYVVVENTVVNGRPTAAGFGPGPFEAVVDILGRHPEFVADPTCERYAITFNRGGFLRRTGEDRR